MHENMLLLLQSNSCYTCIFPVVNSTPSLKDLYENVTARYATSWKRIGILLDLPSKQMIDIEAEYPTNPKRCCNEMLEMWLDIDTNASWGKLLKAIESLAVSSSSDKGN